MRSTTRVSSEGTAVNSIIAEMNRVSSETNLDFLERQIDDVLWSIRHPDNEHALGFVRDASEADRIAAEPVVAHILQTLMVSSLAGMPAVFDADRARQSPEYAERGNWVAFDPSVLLYMPEAPAHA